MVITNSDIYSWLSAAVHLEMHHLENACIEYIDECLSPVNLCDYVNAAVEFKSEILVEKCHRIFSSNTNRVVKHE